MMIGAIVGVLGSLVSGFAAMQQAKYQAAVAEYNMKVAENNANAASQAAQLEAEDQAKQRAGEISFQGAAQGSSGLDLGSPSAVNSRMRTQELAYTEQLRIASRGNQEYTAYMNQREGFRLERDAANSAAGFAMAGGVLNAFGSMVGSAQPSRLASSPTIFAPRPMPASRTYSTWG